MHIGYMHSFNLVVTHAAARPCIIVPLDSWHWKLLVNDVSHKIQIKKESKILIQEFLYKTRYGSEYAGHRFKDKVMTTIICLVIKKKTNLLKKMCYFFILFNDNIIINLYQLYFTFFFSTKQINFSSFNFFTRTQKN